VVVGREEVRVLGGVGAMVDSVLAVLVQQVIVVGAALLYC